MGAMYVLEPSSPRLPPPDGGEKLLQSVLSKENWEHYVKSGVINVKGNVGGTYRILATIEYMRCTTQTGVRMYISGWNIKIPTEPYRTLGLYTVEGYSGLPLYDQIAAQVLFIRFNERLFRQIACG